VRAVDASEIVSSLDSRVSIPSRARRMSDWRSWRDRASRSRFSERAERGGGSFCGEVEGIGKGRGGEGLGGRIVWESGLGWDESGKVFVGSCWGWFF
jgi:hypothetical protein